MYNYSLFIIDNYGLKLNTLNQRFSTGGPRVGIGGPWKKKRNGGKIKICCN